MGTFTLIVMKLFSSLHKFGFQRLVFWAFEFQAYFNLVLWICAALSNTIIINVAVYMCVMCFFLHCKSSFSFCRYSLDGAFQHFLSLKCWLWWWWVHQTATPGMINQSWNNQLQLATDMHSYIKAVDGGHVLAFGEGALTVLGSLWITKTIFW